MTKEVRQRYNLPVGYTRRRRGVRIDPPIREDCAGESVRAGDTEGRFRGFGCARYSAQRRLSWREERWYHASLRPLDAGSFLGYPFPDYDGVVIV